MATALEEILCYSINHLFSITIKLKMTVSSRKFSLPNDKSYRLWILCGKKKLLMHCNLQLGHKKLLFTVLVLSLNG